MMLPRLVIGHVVAAATAVSVRKITRGYSDLKEAKRPGEEGEERFCRAENDLERARTNCEQQPKPLEQLKLEAWRRQLGRFVGPFQKLRNVDLQCAPGMDELGVGFETSLGEMQDVTRRIAEAFDGGTIAASSRVLIGAAGYGGATLFATVSAGTTISPLRGVATTNATIAWFGGGSHAAGAGSRSSSECDPSCHQAGEYLGADR